MAALVGAADLEPGQVLRGCDADAPDERLTAAAAEAEPVRQLRAFTGWVGSGRTLTQTGRVTLGYVLDDATDQQLATWRAVNDRDVRHAGQPDP